MNDMEKSEAKPNRLSGLVAPKGSAARPAEEEAQTRAIVQAPPVASEMEPDHAPTPRASMGVKSLTLRLPEDDYQRLRNYAFKSNTTHQEVLAKALHAYLKRAKA